MQRKKPIGRMAPTVPVRGWLIRAATILMVLISFILTWPAFTDKTRVVTSGADAGDYLPRHIHEGTLLVQPFIAAHDRLGDLAFAFEGNTDAVVVIAVRLFETDGSGTRVHPEQPDYEGVLTDTEIQAYRDTELDIGSIRVKAGTPMDLELDVLHLEDTDAPLSIRTINHVQGGLIENGNVRQTIALYSVVSYNHFNWLFFSICFLLAGLALVLAFDMLRFVDRWVQKARFYPLFLTPLLTLGVIELLNTLNSNLTLNLRVFLMSYLILLGFTFLFYFPIRRVWWAVFLTDALWITFATINHTKIYFRGDPLFTGDILLAGEAVTSLNDLNFQVSPRMLAAILLFFITLLLCRTSTWKPKRSWRIPAAAGGTAVLLALFISVIVCNGHVMQDVFSINQYTWNQMTNYKKNGFVLSFTGSLANLTIETPAYNQVDLDDLYMLPDGGDTEVTDKPNIIVIMSESYTDFRNVRDLPVSEPVMPFFDRLTSRPDVQSGNLLVSVFGGGTCNTEFEFLTGGSLLFLQDGVIPYQSFCHRPTHAIPNLLSEQGYRNVAIHPYVRTFWDRDRVYPNIGFDEFISMDDFESPEYLRRFISDASCFDRIIQEFEETPDDERLFLYAVTMQNHFPYYPEEGDLDDLDYHIQLNGLTDMDSAELYLSLLRQSDDALKDLIGYFEDQDEPVILVFFGDHLPGNNQELMPFYRYLFGEEIADLNMEETRKMYETPYFIWSNTDLPEDTMDLTSPNLLGSYVLDLAGVQKTPYFTFVGSMRDSIAAINTKTVVDNNGTAYDRTDLPLDLQRLLNRYWVYEYDSIVRDQKAD